MNYIVLDLEFNQAFPFKSGKKVEPNPECPFEIIQIGAVKLNERFEQLDSFNCMISPQISAPLRGKNYGDSSEDARRTAPFS